MIYVAIIQMQLLFILFQWFLVINVFLYMHQYLLNLFFFILVFNL